jgi:DNA polymerase-4
MPPRRAQDAEFLGLQFSQAQAWTKPQRLGEIGIHTIGDIANWPEADLIRRFGKNGADLSRHAHGISESPIITEHETKSISQETTFTRDIQDPERLKQTLREQSAQVGEQLRKENLKGRTVKLKLRWHDFTTLTRQTTLPSPTDQDEEIYTAVLGLFEGVWKPAQPVRLLGVGVSHFDSPPPVRQLSLWDVEPAEHVRLRQVLDELQARYGSRVIHQGKIK